MLFDMFIFLCIFNLYFELCKLYVMAYIFRFYGYVFSSRPTEQSMSFNFYTISFRLAKVHNFKGKICKNNKPCFRLEILITFMRPKLRYVIVHRITFGKIMLTQILHGYFGYSVNIISVCGLRSPRHSTESFTAYRRMLQ